MGIHTLFTTEVHFSVKRKVRGLLRPVGLPSGWENVGYEYREWSPEDDHDGGLGPVDGVVEPWT